MFSVGLVGALIFGFAFAMAALAYGLNEITRHKHRRRSRSHDPLAPVRRHRRWVILIVWGLAWGAVVVTIAIATKMF